MSRPDIDLEHVADPDLDPALFGGPAPPGWETPEERWWRLSKDEYLAQQALEEREWEADADLWEGVDAEAVSTAGVTTTDAGRSLQTTTE